MTITNKKETAEHEGGIIYLRLTQELTDELDEIVDSLGYRSRNSLVKDLIDQRVNGTLITNEDLKKQIEKQTTIIEQNAALMSFMMTVIAQLCLVEKADPSLIKKFSELGIATLKENDNQKISSAQFTKILRDTCNSSFDFEQSSSFAVHPENYLGTKTIETQDQIHTDNSSAMESQKTILAYEDDINDVKKLWKTNPHATGNGYTPDGDEYQFTKEEYDKNLVQSMPSRF